MNKKYLIIVILSAITLMYSQGILDGQDAKFLNLAKDLYRDGDYNKAMDQMEIVSAEIKKTPEYHQLMAQIYIAQQEFESAINELNIFIQGNAGIDVRLIEKKIDILKSANSSKQQEKEINQTLSKILGDVNSNSSDFAPVILPDKTGMYYTSLKTAPYRGLNIWFVENNNGIWTNSRPVTRLSADRNESLGSLSSDGQTAYLFGNFYGANEGDIFYSSLINEQWSKPLNIGSINTEYTEMQPFMFNDKMLFFVSNRPGGYGGFDLYVSEFNGSWNEPQNLGSVINTNLNEDTPFLDWDGTTLYFASEGHPGLGEFDIFKSSKIGSSWQDWSEPQNMGVIINSVRNDRCFTHAKNDNDWYLSSDRVGGNGFEDIYKVNISNNKEYINPVAVISGSVTDIDDNKPISEVILQFASQNSGNKRTVVTDEQGKFEISIESNKNYKVFVDKDGFNSISEELNIESDLVLNYQLRKNQGKFEIENIYFALNDANLKKESYPALDDLIRTLQINFSKSVEIQGHTDNTGSDEYNLKLSQKRANSVADYLINNGISKSRIISKGYGETMPVDTNETEEGRINNRRVEIKIFD